MKILTLQDADANQLIVGVEDELVYFNLFVDDEGHLIYFDKEQVGQLIEALKKVSKVKQRKD